MPDPTPFRLEVSRDADGAFQAAYLRIKPGDRKAGEVLCSVELVHSKGAVVDYDAKGLIVGIEFLVPVEVVGKKAGERMIFAAAIQRQDGFAIYTTAFLVDAANEDEARGKAMRVGELWFPGKTFKAIADSRLLEPGESVVAQKCAACPAPEVT